MTVKSYILQICVVLLTSLLSAFVYSETTVRVLDKHGSPVEGVLVFSSAVSNPANPEGYVMDQVDLAFNPSVLVVPVGAKVLFPNSDPVAHHVYSISRPNNFSLPLYRGQLPNPIRFDHEGVVVLGCNIHDHMVGHIVVTDRVLQGQTNAQGYLSLMANEQNLGPDATVQIWSPRIRSRELTVQSLVQDTEHTFQLERRLRPPIHRVVLTDY
ncbi:MAG: methylamine utilization protein [Pseudomonadota bacterium]